jgi:hypothetical protein
MADEILVEAQEVHGFTHPLQEKAEMDVVLALKNLLAFEDHLREFAPENEQEEVWRDRMLRDVESLRTEVMLLVEEKDKRYHCMAKHAIAATGALEEVSKLYHEESKEWPQSEDFDFAAEKCRDLQNMVLENLWGHKLVNCKRCK